MRKPIPICGARIPLFEIIDESLEGTVGVSVFIPLGDELNGENPRVLFALNPFHALIVQVEVGHPTACFRWDLQDEAVTLGGNQGVLLADFPIGYSLLELGS